MITKQTINARSGRRRAEIERLSHRNYVIRLTRFGRINTVTREKRATSYAEARDVAKGFTGAA